MRAPAALEEISAHFNGRRCGDGFIIECPSGLHQRRIRRAKLWEDSDGTRRVWCYACGSSRPPLEGLRAAGLPIDSGERKPLDPIVMEIARLRRGRDEAERRNAALQIWERSVPLKGTRGLAYIEARGIQFEKIPSSLRYRPALKHSACGCTHPAIVALVVGSAGRAMGITRIFLSRDGTGKAECGDRVKMALGPIMGGAVRLAPAAQKVVIAEGVESAASAGELLRLPAWAALSARGIERIELPDLVEHVVIFADRDRAGMDAARNASVRFQREGREVSIALADEPFGDANDELMARRAESVAAGIA